MPVYALGDQVPDIDPLAYVHPDAVVIGSVRLGAEASVWGGAVIRADVSPILIGARTSVQDGTVVHTTAEHPTTIGAECVIGHLVHLEGCVIGDGALLGSGSVVLHRAVVEPGALVGANALVPNGMVVPSRAMALGVPAKLRLDSVDAAALIEPGMQSYVERAHLYRKELRRLD